MIGQAALPTPELVFEPLLPELVLVVFAIAGLLYEAFAKRSELDRASLDRSRRSRARGRDEPVALELGRSRHRAGQHRGGRTASPSSPGCSCSPSPRSV